ncbi:hypothetical protein ZWY2020_008759 [Hordeum vulgare]|nr:hypothetical protein ZWY2020_052007 [Hordeum vulgare]KAI5007711.1 hypothetical protein ZWY2020_008759 [Hordeum vulgare]
MALLASWGKRFYDEFDKDWEKIICYKYGVDKPNFFWSKNTLGFPFLKSVTWALGAAKHLFKWVPGNGINIAFWRDIWIGECSLNNVLGFIFNICHQQEASLAQIWHGMSLSGL